MPVRAVIANAVCLNTGDAAINLATRSILQQTVGLQGKIAVLDPEAEASAKYYDEFDFVPPLSGASGGPRGAGILPRAQRKLRNLRTRYGEHLWADGRRQIGRLVFDPATARTADAIQAADLVLSAGGTYITDHYEWRFRFRPLDLAKKLGKPVVFMTQSMGVFHDQAKRAWLADKLPAYDLFLVRDQKSEAFLRDMGVAPQKVRQAYDAVFAMADPDLMDAVLQRLRAKRHKVERVAISVRDWKHFGDKDAADGMARYKDSIAAAVAALVRDHGAAVTFLSTCQGIPEYWTDDSRLAQTIHDGLPDDVKSRCDVATRHHHPLDLIQAYSAFDLVIATRMHACILALCAGVPVLPIAYEFKTAELYKKFGLADRVQEIGEMSAEGFKTKLATFITDLPTLHDQLVQQTTKARTSALSAGNQIGSVLGAHEHG